MQVRKIVWMRIGMSLGVRANMCSGGMGGSIGSTLCTPISDLMGMIGMGGSGGQPAMGGAEGSGNAFSLNCVISGSGGATGGAPTNPCGSETGGSMGGSLQGHFGPGSIICNNVSLSAGGQGGSWGNDCYSKMNGPFAGGSGFLNTQKMNEICCVPSATAFSKFR